ncbi:MAG TPA: sugar ABC transporter substrate-binding protein [Streptosporangiaceae bacterium]|nr:sugar ABC transporter substrate-binding protein [Streptosporangiaceae bacterium]
MQRLRALATTAGGLVFVALAIRMALPAQGTALCQKSQLRLVNSMREIAQPYHVNLNKGGRMFATWAGLDSQYVLQLNQGDSDKQVALMRALLATNPQCTVFNVEPNADVVVKPMVETANQTGAWIVTHWAHNKGLHPFAGNDHWIAHVAVNSEEVGVAVSERLVAAIGGQGGIVALQGRLDTDPAQKRFAGLQKVLARHADVSLLAQQTANWDRTAAFPIMQTWLAKYGDQIKAVWAANDDMALGALEALRAVGRAGRIPIVGVDGIPEAIAAIARGEMTATVSSDAFYQGSIGLAMGVCVLTGQAPLPQTWGKEQREYYLRVVVITQDNAAQYLQEPTVDASISEWQCDRLWGRATGPAF